MSDITEAQRCALECAASAQSKDWCGIHPRRGQHQMFAALVQRGLLDDIGPGVDADDHSRDVTLYVITAKGRKAIGGIK